LIRVIVIVIGQMMPPEILIFRSNYSSLKAILDTRIISWQ